MTAKSTLTVCVEGVEVSREFDAEDEAIDAIGEAMWRKLQQPHAVVTLLVGPLVNADASYPDQFGTDRVNETGPGNESPEAVKS